MKGTLLTTSVREPDLDMTRVTARPTAGVLRRLIGSIFRSSYTHHHLVTPSRSVDREQQKDSPDLG